MASLLESGNSLKDTLLLLNLNDEEIFDFIQQGNTFEQYLLKEGKGPFYEHFSFFIGICYLSDAIHNSIQMMQMEDEFVKKLKKESAYPIFIFLFSFIAIYMFTVFIIPMLLNSFSEVDSNSVFIVLLDLIKIGSILSFILIFIILILYILFKYVDSVHYFIYKNLVPYIPFLKQYISYTLSGYLIQLDTCGMSTKESLLYLIHFNHKTLTIRLVKDLYDELIHGNELTIVIKNNNYLDSMFKQYLLTGIYSSKTQATLKSYMETRWILWEKMIKRIILSIQLIAYAFVGILLICVYQIMLMPLQMIETL